MAEPMSAARLADIRELGTVSPLAREAAAEIDRLRAALAARPEPIGYVAAYPIGNFTAIDYGGAVFPTAARARRSDSDRVYALVPVEAES